MSDSKKSAQTIHDDIERIGFVRRVEGLSITEQRAFPDMRRMERYRYARLQREIVAAECAGALLINSVNLRYATSAKYSQVFNLHSPFRAVFVPPEGKAIFFGWDPFGSSAPPDFIGEDRPAPIAAYFAAGDAYLDVTRRWAAEIVDLARIHGGGLKRLAIDHSEPEFVLAVSQTGFEIVNAEKLVDHAASIKSDDELHCMALAVSVAESGLARIKREMRAGLSERELWAELVHENARNGGEWFEYCILTSGGRTNPWGRECSDKIIRAGELIGVDTGMIGPFGYGADISRTFHCGPGKPTVEQKRLYRYAAEQVANNVELLRAGMGFQEFAEKSWQVPDEFWARRYNSVAHGIGMGNEWPHIPFAKDRATDPQDGVFKENMVMAVESCIGREDGVECVKIEEMVVVKDGKCHLLSTFPYEDELLN